MNIIIPVAGVGRRFVEESYSVPKPLIRSLGKQIILRNIESLNISSQDVVYVVYRSEFDVFNFRSLLKNEFSNINFEFIAISNDTRGAAETVLHAVNNISENYLNDLTIVIDSDNCYEDDIIQAAKQINNNVVFYTENFDEKPIYSYIQKTGEQVTTITEKQKISNDICVGAYCFKTANILKQTIIKTISNNKKQNNEYYISSLYQVLIEQGIEVLCSKVTNFKCLGTPLQLKAHSSNLHTTTETFRFCFDLDNTLVTSPAIKGDYTSVNPIQKNIDFLNSLYNQGHHIIIHTARRMRTFNGNVGAVQADIGQLTFETLSKFRIKYHEVYFGKPHAHFYIDDLAVSAFSDLEKETGFYNTHPKTRNHNSIEILKDCIIKHSSNIQGELFFYKNIPNELKSVFAKLIDSGEDFIKLEKINGTPLSSLNCNRLLSKDILINVLQTLTKIHNAPLTNLNVDIYGNYARKIQQRFNSYDYSRFPQATNTKNQLINYFKCYEKDNKGTIGIVHGDPVLTNILLDNNDSLKFIDMRGKVGETLTIAGDIFYDYAKLYQSIIGYDFILMGKELDDSYIQCNKKIFKEYIDSTYNSDTFDVVKNITASLFFTLIPLHDNEKCNDYFKMIEKL